MPVEIWVGNRRLEELDEEERARLASRVLEAERAAVQSWIDENSDMLYRMAVEGRRWRKGA